MTELVLNTYGTCLAKENSNFVVIHKDGRQMIAPDKLKSVSISKGASITSDAALLAIQHHIDVIFVEACGKTIGRIWSVKFGSISTIRRNQLDFISSKEAIIWIKNILCQKIDNSIALCISYTPEDNAGKRIFSKSIQRLEAYKNKIYSIEAEFLPDISSTLRGWEGVSSKIYFETINFILPVKFRFEGRSQHPSLDLFNCLLNYGYGILYGKIESAMIKAGIDPYIGVLHRDDYNRPVLVYDIIELFRVWIDYVVICLLQQNAIDEDCFSVKEDGSYWLENMGKKILIQSVNDYLAEIIYIKGLERSRLTHIDLYCQHLAQKFLKFNK